MTRRSRSSLLVLALIVATLACGGRSDSSELGSVADQTRVTEESQPTLQAPSEQMEVIAPTVSSGEAQPETAFAIGQVIYLVPELVEASPGPYGLGRAITKIPHRIGMFESVSNCDDLAQPEPKMEWVFHNQQGHITDVLPCGDRTFYRVKVDKFLYSDEWNDWLLEDQIVVDTVSPVGFPFVLELRSDQEFPGPYSPYLTHLPAEFALREGAKGETFIGGQPARISLLQASEVINAESNIYRFISTEFSLVNEGTADIVFDSRELLAGKYNAVDVEANPSDELIQESSVNVVVSPNESAEFEVIWRMFERPTTERTLAIYIAVNTQIHDHFYIFMNDDSLFFRELIEPQQP